MWHDIQQNTDEWLELRAGKVTGSAISKIMANYGKAFGEPAKKYAVEIAVERMKGSAIRGDRYTTAHMEAGHVEEPVARMLYEERRFCEVNNGGFFDNGKTGCSPDGLVWQDGIIEIKSVTPYVHLACIKRAAPDPAYNWQLLFNLRESGRDWIDYTSYCEQFVADKKLVVFRVERKDCAEQLAMIESRLEQFEALVDDATKYIDGYK